MMTVVSEFWSKEENLKAQVVYENGEWGCNFYKDDQFVKNEVYHGKSEYYAESAAENYVEGIKVL